MLIPIRLVLFFSPSDHGARWPRQYASSVFAIRSVCLRVCVYVCICVFVDASYALFCCFADRSRGLQVLTAERYSANAVGRHLRAWACEVSHSFCNVRLEVWICNRGLNFLFVRLSHRLLKQWRSFTQTMWYITTWRCCNFIKFHSFLVLTECFPWFWQTLNVLVGMTWHLRLVDRSRFENFCFLSI